MYLENQIDTLPDEKRFLCSQKHLTFASRRASKIFSSNFKEASKQDDGFYHWKFEDLFDAEAFELVLNIIHGKTRNVPRAVSLDLLAAVASIVDDLECHDTVAFFSQGWIVSYENLAPTSTNTLAKLILVSFVFENASIFKTVTRLAIQHSRGTVSSYDLPIRVAIMDLMESRRLTILHSLLVDLDALEKDLLDEKAGCSRVCRSMLLGDLIQATKGCGLYPRPSAPFDSLAVHQVIHSLRNAPSSKCFSSVEDCVDSKHSDRWCRAVQSAASAGPHQGSGGIFFGAGAAPQFQVLHQQQVTHTGHSCQSPFSVSAAPQVSGSLTGLFGPKDAQKNKLPPVLVQHHCSLTQLMAPIISRAEAWKTGLELPDYLGP
ncbi:hypothetical protein HG530_007015 [Fusarium avenaceum]|nr:hypothetical protein HG530_007015 [Fusarium avenaceum]